MAILESNTDLDVKGRVLATTVPNSTGSLVTWNASTKVFGLRSNAQVIADLGLQSNIVAGNHINKSGNTISTVLDDGIWLKDSNGNNRIHVGSITTTNDFLFRSRFNDTVNFKWQDSTGANYMELNHTTLRVHGLASSQIELLQADSSGSIFKSGITPSSLITSSNIGTYLVNKAERNGSNLTSIQTWRNALGIGTLANLTTTYKTDLVGAINEVNTQSGNYVPYTGATANVNLGTRTITSTGGFIGNASTASTLATARTINGTLFDGTANITTALWGTSRNITIGNTTKAVNGSANVSWSLAEIGASSVSHTHPISDVIGLQAELNTKLESADLDGFIYDVQYNSSTHTITFFQQNEPDIVIDLPIEQLIKGVQLVGDDLVFTFEDGSTVTVPMNTLLVGVVKSVNGKTPNSQGEIVLNITDIPNLSSALDGKANAGGNNLTNIGTWQSNLGIGDLTALTTTNKNDLVGAINEVNGNTENYIPFIFTRNSVTQKLLNAEKNFGVSSTGRYIVIDTGRNTHFMTTYEITVRQYGSNRGSVKFLISWQDNNANLSSIDTILCSNPNLYPSVRLAKDANTNFGCIIIETNTDLLSYCTVVIDRIIGQNTTNSHTIYSAENLDNFINIRTGPYNRDSYYLNYNNFTNTPTIPTPSDYITTNTNQTGLSGNKTTSGIWNFNPASTTSARFEYTPSDNISSGIRLDNYNVAGNKRYADFSLNAQLGIAGIGYGSVGSNLPNGSTDTSNFGMWVNATNDLFAGRNIYANSGIVESLNGFSKTGATNNDMLLGSGGHRPVSDFALAGSLGNYLPLAGGTMNSGAAINWAGTQAFLQLNSVNKLRYSNVATILSASSTAVGTGQGIFIRPQGDTVNAGQIHIDYNGQINTTNHGNSSQWKQAYDWGDHRIYNANGSDQYLGGNHISGGQQKPDYFGGGKLKLQMLRGDNIGATVNGTATSQWLDALWLSSYTGGGVPGSNALFFGKQGTTIGFARQNFDSTSWGAYTEIIHESNLDFHATNLGYVKSASLSGYVPTARTITAGNGLSGGGNLTANRTITLGTPSAITLSSTNSVTTSSHTHAFTPGGTTAQYIRGDGSLATMPTFTDAITTISRNGVNIPIVSQNVDIPVFSTSGAGLVPARVGSVATKYLREDGTWVTPANTTYSNMAIAELNTGTVATGRIISASVLNQWLNAKGYVTTDTVTRLRGTTSGTYTSGDLTLVAGANTTITQSGANITIASTNTNTTYSGSTSIILSGTSFQRAALTGDVTASQNSNATTIANSAVTNAKMANMPANTFKGRLSTTGAPQDLTVAQMQSILGIGGGSGIEKIFTDNSSFPGPADQTSLYFNFHEYWGFPPAFAEETQPGNATAKATQGQLDFFASYDSVQTMIEDSGTADVDMKGYHIVNVLLMSNGGDVYLPDGMYAGDQVNITTKMGYQINIYANNLIATVGNEVYTFANLVWDCELEGWVMTAFGAL